MNPRLRHALIVVAVSVIAAWLGSELADGSYFWPGLAGATAIAAILVRVLRLPADVILIGLVTFGYIVGNRGFAQLMPAPGLPLLPAEGALLFAGGWWLVAAAFERRIPWQRDALNWLVLAWLAVGTARLAFDLHRYGFLAIRDYAAVYYALFFFIAQRMARDPAARRFLTFTLLAASLVLLPLVVLFDTFPEFFITRLTVAGAPLIYYKGDIANTFVGGASFLIFFSASRRHRWWAWPASAGLFLFATTGGNRAAMFGTLIACAFLLATRRWKFVAWQAGVGFVAAMVVLGLAIVGNNSWAQRKIDGLTDRVRSVVDIRGEGVYRSEDSSNKGDNNRFRAVWWWNVTKETWLGNPVFGLGFGTDLARGFVQEYYPDATEEFTTRSPHSIFVTAFGRMGAIGLLVWCALCTAIVGRAWRALRRTTDEFAWALWCLLLLILVSAAVGVVLEGPMGAVPFWIVLGLLSHREPAAAAGSAQLADATGDETAIARAGRAILAEERPIGISRR